MNLRLPIGDSSYTKIVRKSNSVDYESDDEQKEKTD